MTDDDFFAMVAERDEKDRVALARIMRRFKLAVSITGVLFLASLFLIWLVFSHGLA